MELKKLPDRKHIPAEKTWDLTQIYSADNEWEKDFIKVDDMILPLMDLRGKLGQSADNLVKCMELQDNLGRVLDKLFNYAHLKSDEDISNSGYLGMLDRITHLDYNCSAKLSWIRPEIMNIKDDKISEYLESKELEFYGFALRKILRFKPYTLSDKEEKIMAMIGELSNVPYKAFSMINNTDIRFPDVPDDEGQTVELSHGLFGKLLKSRDRDIRIKAYTAMYDAFSGFKNTLSATLDGSVKADVINSRIRNYPSALEASLFADNVNKEVYENLVKTINDNLHIFHRYIALRKKALHIDDLNMYDLYVPIIKDIDLKVSWEQACDWVMNAVSVFGEEYGSVVKKAFSERWIDILECRGKRSGAYSSGCYDTNPYILMNYNETLNDVFTLAHELGHSVHSYFSRTYQDYCYSRYSIFTAEVASTTNELLLTDYLIKTTSDDNFKMYLLNQLCDGFKGTVFRQAQFAEFEKLIHEKSEANIPLTVDELNRTYYQINKKYYGPDIKEPDRRIQLEWVRIPHFYYNFYVYKYATGFSAAVCLSENILSGDQAKINAYLAFLKAGSSKYPLDILKDAGVDLTTPGPLLTGLKKFEAAIELLEKALWAGKNKS